VSPVSFWVHAFSIIRDDEHDDDELLPVIAIKNKKDDSAAAVSPWNVIHPLPYFLYPKFSFSQVCLLVVVLVC
jgi:hypothetical protein